MADLARPAATRAAERKGDMASIGHQAEAVHALAPDIEVSVITAIRIAVERPFGEQVQRQRPEPPDKIGSASGRERVCQDVEISGVARTLKKKKTKIQQQ